MIFPTDSGTHALFLNGPNGLIQVGLSIPENPNWSHFALVGHPHPLFDGTMNNKVVTTTARAMLGLNMPVLRFNFRGVGQSEGVFDHGLGESADMLWILQQWQKQFINARIFLSGFSFGSYVAFRVAQQMDVHSLILIAPPVERFDFDLTQLRTRPDVIFQGDADEVVSAEQVKQFATAFSPPIPMEWFLDTGHFFHGKLVQLKQAVEKWGGACLN